MLKVLHGPSTTFSLAMLTSQIRPKAVRPSQVIFSLMWQRYLPATLRDATVYVPEICRSQAFWDHTVSQSMYYDDQVLLGMLSQWATTLLKIKMNYQKLNVNNDIY